MDENHQAAASQKQVTTENKLWLPPSYINNKPATVSSASKEKVINWGFAHRSIWEWFLLLATLLAAIGAIAIPFVVTIIGLNFTQQQAQLSIAASERQHQTDLQIAQDQQRATILQTYIDNIQDLLLNHNLRQAKSTDDVAILARARTLIALQQLDAVRKADLLQFLYENNLIGYIDDIGKKHDRIINLDGANFSGAILGYTETGKGGTEIFGLELEGADLSGVDMSNAHLIGTDLVGASLFAADLHNAVIDVLSDLEYTDLSGADLSGATIAIGVILSSADLEGANLDGVTLDHVDLSSAGLEGASLGGTIFSFDNLRNTNLVQTDLSNANFTNPNDLTDANLSGAFVSYVNLSNVEGLTQKQLDQVSSCTGAILPKGLICRHNR